jgi:hypothetical protein
MTRHAQPLILLIFFACASAPPSPLCRDLARLENNAVPRHQTVSGLSGAGRGLPESWDDFEFVERTRIPVRVGEWTYVHPNGKQAAQLTYALSCYVQCCTPGPCPQVHDRPVGPFRFWYPSGAKLAEGTFVDARVHVDTSCEGGDDTVVGRVSDTSKFWRENGDPVSVEDAVRDGLLPNAILLRPRGAGRDQ